MLDQHYLSIGSTYRVWCVRVATNNSKISLEEKTYYDLLCGDNNLNNADSMLCHRMWRWPNIEPALRQSLCLLGAIVGDNWVFSRCGGAVCPPAVDTRPNMIDSKLAAVPRQAGWWIQENRLPDLLVFYHESVSFHSIPATTSLQGWN